MTKKKIVIDTDPGIDDALAILLALASPEIEVLGLTIVAGNCMLEQGVINALSLLDLGKRPDIPVIRGAERPLIQPLKLSQKAHGGTGLGWAQLPVSKNKPIEGRAANFMIDQSLKYAGEITLVCIGPLTNLALALRLAPEIKEAVTEVIIMGGSIRYGGNTTPAAEFNIFCDPHAAHIVFESGMPLTLVPLDVTHQVVLRSDDIRSLMGLPSPVPQFISDATGYYISNREGKEIDGCYVHDPLALGLAFQPNLVDFEQLFVQVDMLVGASLGRTSADFSSARSQTPNMRVATSVRPRAFIELFLRRMQDLCRSLAN